MAATCNKNKQLFLLGLLAASGLAGDCNKNNHCSSGEFCYSGTNSCSNRNCDCHDCDDYNGAPGFTSGTHAGGIPGADVLVKGRGVVEHPDHPRGA